MVNAIRPQPGPQTALLQSPADIVIYGGSAGGGKSFGLLLSALRYKDVDGFGCTIFRKNFRQIYNQGGLWDESNKIYSLIPGAEGKFARGEWFFNNKKGKTVSKVSFAHIDRDADLLTYQGSQICEIGFDELTHFTERQFFYMLSRNRSTCGVKPHIIGTCNPDADSWVAKFISWWINPETGYPIPERSGKIRYFIRRNEKIYWANRKQTLWDQFGLKTEEEKAEPKSVTFIMSSVYDNKILLKADPGYLANLKALAVVERERLLRGNWRIKAAAGLYFKRSQVGNFIEVIPDDVICWVRCWDLAATAKTPQGDPAYTAGVLIGKRKNGRYVIADVVNEQMSASDVRATIKHTAQLDTAKYKHVRIRIPQDPGQAGKDQAENYIKYMSGYDITAVTETGSKEARATPFAAQWQAGNVDLVIGDWNEDYLLQLENFPDAVFKDMVDASSNGFAEVEIRSQFNLGNLL